MGSLLIKDLFEIIFKKLHPLYSIDCGALILYNQDVSAIKLAYVSEYSANTGGFSIETITNQRELSAILKEIASFDYPVLKSCKDWEGEFSENHALLNNNSDYHFHCYLPLEINNQVLGTMELHNYGKELSTEGLTFCSNIADLLAEAIYLAEQAAATGNTTVAAAVQKQTEIITSLEQADDLRPLLTLSTALLTARTKEELDTVIATRFKKLFGYDGLMIRLLAGDKATHYTYLSSVQDVKEMAHAGLLKPDSTPADDAIFKKVSGNDCPVMFDLYELKQDAGLPGYVKFWQANGMVQMIGVPLLAGQAVAGMLLLCLMEKQVHQAGYLTLLKGMATQLAAAIAQVQWYEKLQTQIDGLHTYKEQVEQEQLYVPEQAGFEHNYTEIVGRSAEMQKVFQLLDQVAAAESTILILGETGAGKELIARAIHHNSKRKDKQMVKVNCAAIPPNLIESELFGHEKGSFTGATERRIGKFELADNSTLFLDEIGELSLELQVKLLRVLQEKEIERVGGKATIRTDVRVVSATNRNLLEEVEAGRFRKDLYYRLNVFPIHLPSLRKRKEDIPLLATHFLNRFAGKTDKNISGFSQRVLQRMMNYHWPGNIREMEHLIERQVLLTRGALIKDIEIPGGGKAVVIMGDEIVPVKTIDENERDHIFAVLQLCKGKISGTEGAARLLGVPATTLNSKIKRLGLAKKHQY